MQLVIVCIIRKVNIAYSAFLYYEMILLNFNVKLIAWIQQNNQTVNGAYKPNIFN